MSELCIRNIDRSTVERYNSATEEEQQAAGQLLSCWFSGDAVRLEQLLARRRQQQADDLLREALEYADRHPVFALHWAQNRMTREEMNER
jgi:hypothetical protein